MEFRLRLGLALTLLFSVLSILVSAQTPLVQGHPTDYTSGRLAAGFKAYKVYEINSDLLLHHVSSADFDHRVRLELPGQGDFEMDLFESQIFGENYALTVASETGVQTIRGHAHAIPLFGNLKGGQYAVSLTVNHGFIFGGIQQAGGTFLRIEPLYLYERDAAQDLFIVYNTADAIDLEPRTCGTLEHQQQVHQAEQQDGVSRQVGDCLEVEIAYADDWLMFDDHGNTVPNVENHNIGVMNDVQTNYDNEFADELHFVIVEIWVSTCSTCDPWSNTTNSGTLLDEFRAWGPGGFDETYDVADLWTDRDFDGSTIGVSWLDAVCTSFRYLTTQDFTGNGNLLRVLLAHELGHNFGSNHDPENSPTIMAPAVSNTNAWSSSSVSQINSYVNGINCLSLCQTIQAPVADFSADDVDGCTPFVVHFTDESSGPPTSWDWTFPGGSPASSTQQNPTVTYNTPGVYDVILEVSNAAGTNTLVRTNYISVQSEPTADFIYNQVDLTLNFTNLSEYGTSWLWNFGDGSTSTIENPSHTYDEDGTYNITLTVSNTCGSDQFMVTVDVYVAPEAGFSADPDFGCAPLIVNFFNESSTNVQSLQWFFPGGSPGTSTQENPVVTYETPGFYSVTLIVENIAGVDELTVSNYIEVVGGPEAEFSHSINGLTVQFINASVNADNYLWVFGDGATSTSASPNHTYTTGGTYQVMLIASNACGPDTAFATVILNGAPVANFVVSQSSGCAPLTVQYTSTSQGEVTSYNWSFPGGSPASSTAMAPVVTYQTPGTYDAQLIVGNPIGFDTLYLPSVVVVSPDVISNFDANVQGTIGTFINMSSGASSYLWNLDGQSFNTEDLVYDFGEDGAYLVQLIATGTCGTDTFELVVQIATPPTAGITSGPTAGCQPFTVQFNNNSSPNATTFEWIFEGGTPATSNLENPVIQYLQPGVFDVQLTVWSGGGMDVLVMNDLIEVAPLPVASFATSQEGLEVTFVNASVYADQFLWFFGDGANSTEQNPVHVYGDYGTYPVMLISENACGFDTMTLELLLSTAPVPHFSIGGSGSAMGCVPFEVQFMDQSQNNPEVWEWSFPGGTPDTSNLQNPTIVYDIPGIYSVILRVSNSGGTQVLVVDDLIYVDVPPVAEFDHTVNQGEATFTNLSEGGDAYFWTFGDGLVDTTANPVHLYQSSGTYNVQLVVYNACDTDTIIHQVTVSLTGINDLGDHARAVLYPNPNSGSFVIDIEGTTEMIDLVVYDLLGRQVSARILNGTSPHEISLENASPGVYTVVLTRQEYRQVIKVVVSD